MSGMCKIAGKCLILAFVAAAFSCSGGGDTAKYSGVPVGDDDAGSTECVDKDHDGYGRYCSAGSDCDDNDPDITDECRRCLAAAKDCPCKPGTAQTRCTPPVMHVDGGTLVCSEGTRYCRDGYWGDCETIGQYVFVAD